MIELWLREQDKTLLENLSKVSLSGYLDSSVGRILTGTLDNPGVLSKIRKEFVLGRESVWIPKDTDQKYHFVRIDNSSAYSNGLILTPYSAIDVEYHLRSKTIDKKTRFERVELEGMEKEDFVERVFRTYYGFLVRKFGYKDDHFLLYSTVG